jgi:hypothetical protein
VTYEEGHFYRDRDGDIWQAEKDDRLTFAAFADRNPDVSMGDTLGVTFVEDSYGPLIEVRPIGWEAV